VPVLATDAPQR